MTRTEVNALHRFLVRWMRRTTPNFLGLRTYADGRVMTKDTLGWRDAGTMADWIPVARALGALA